ncbi:MAG: VanW family protein [Lachnospiraceae bacterium]|nr:VanW family protein [Lachnospiraceae bacterium]
MRNGRITKRILVIALAVIAGSFANPAGVSAYSGDDVLAGANDLVREAFETVRSGSGSSVGEGSSFNMDIESLVERDLSGTIMNGIYVDDIDLSGKTYDEAVNLITDKVDAMSEAVITLNSIGENSTKVTAAELGLKWDEKDVVADALYVGRDGSIVDRYKQRKDLEHEKKVYPLRVVFDRNTVTSVVKEQGDKYNVEAKNATLTKEDGDFHVTGGTTGEVVDVNASVSRIMSKLDSFNGDDVTVDLVVVQDVPKASVEDLEKVHDIIGSYKTSFSTSGADRSGNVRNGTRLVNGTVLLPGESFSMYDTVSPFTEENGYYLAGSYLNGMVVESLGGGICQVSSTLYNAVLRAELQVNERHNHSMIVSYVDLSSDAAISGTSKDFKFTNSSEYPIYIEGITTSDKQVIFNIYGVETRPDNRKVSFESEQLSETIPEGDKIIADPSAPVGSISTQSAHTGYTGKLWKIVTVDGKETERTEVNKSTYLPTPRTATVGTGTDNPAALAMIQSAIATGSIDAVKATVGELNAAASAAAAAEAAMQGLGL